MVKATTMESVNANVTKDELDDMRGTLISENTIGVIHDHFLCFHMDLDVDGPSNSFVQGKFVRYNVPAEVSPRRSYWSVERHVAKTEEEARIQFNLDHPAEFYVVNPSKQTRLGNQVSYRVVPGGSISSILDTRLSPQIRAAFTDNQVPSCMLTCTLIAVLFVAASPVSMENGILVYWLFSKFLQKVLHANVFRSFRVYLALACEKIKVMISHVSTF